MPKLDERISSLETKLKQFKVQQQRLAARERASVSKEAREDDARRKILIGATVLSRVDSHRLEQSELKAWLDAHLTLLMIERSSSYHQSETGILVMGLDTIELFLNVEKHFQIKIPDPVASTVMTVGLLHRWVVEELNRQGRPTDAQRVYSERRNLICGQLGVEPGEVVPEARFVQDLHADYATDSRRTTPCVLKWSTA